MIGLVRAVLLDTADLIVIPHCEDPRINMLRLLCVCKIVGIIGLSYLF